MKKNTSTQDFVSQIEARLIAGVMPVERALSDEAAEIAEAIQTQAQTKAEAQRPDISRLPDAVVNGVARVGVGDRIVIERRASFLKGNPYLDTRTYQVKGIDAATGNRRGTRRRRGRGRIEFVSPRVRSSVINLWARKGTQGTGTCN